MKSNKPNLIAFRRHLHTHPELSKKEHQTQAYIVSVLNDYGISNIKAAHTGVVATINQGQKPCIAIRADIDALPIHEANDVSYRSQHEGVMHACGHDAHTAILLGTAIQLEQQKSSLEGSVKLFFQPNEEVSSGAKDLVQEGYMDDVDMIIGLHVMPHLEVGYIETRYEALNASTTTVDITVKGQSSHAAYPHLGIDALMITTDILQALRNKDIPGNPDPFILSMTMIKGGTKRNVIADNIHIKGTLRTLSEESKTIMKEWITRTAEHIAHKSNGTVDVVLHDGYPPLINDSTLVDIISESATSIVGADNFVLKESPSMGAEDFGYYQTKAPGAFYHIGCGNKQKGILSPLHSSTFDIDERCLEIGMNMHLEIVRNILKKR